MSDAGFHADHEHDEEDTRPLTPVDAAPLHEAVDRLTATLHTYVDTVAGVRTEFGVAEADVDPRVIALETRVAELNGALYEALHSTLGVHAHLVGLAVAAPEDEEEEEDLEGYEAFHLGFLVAPQAGGAEVPIDAVLGIVDEAGADLARRLLDLRFDVPEWGAARGEPVLFDDDDEDDA